MSIQLYPYKAIPNGIVVELDAGAGGQKSGNILKVYDGGPPKGFVLEMTAMAPAEWTDLLPPSERADPPVKMVASITCIEGRVRHSVELKRKGDKNTYHGILKVDPDKYAGELAIQLMLIRTRAASRAHDGLAQDRGVRLTWSETQRVQLSPPKPSIGSLIQILWKKFSEAGGDLAHFPGALYHLDQTGAVPTLFLNEDGSDELYKLLEVGGFGHEKAIARESIFSFISTAVIQTILQDIVVQLHDLSNGSSSADLENLLDWQSEAVEQLAPELYPDFPKPDAKRQFLDEVCDDAGLSNLIRTRIPLAIQVSQAVRKSCEKLAERIYEHG